MFPVKRLNFVYLILGRTVPLLLIACNGQVRIKSVTASELHGKMAAIDQRKKYLRPIGQKM